MREGDISPWTRFSRTAAMLLVLLLAACAARPSAMVLQPVQGAQPTQDVSILVATNRAQANDGGYAPVRATQMTFERYTISVPPRRNAADLDFATGQPDLTEHYAVVSRERLDEAGFETAVERALAIDGASGIYVHGYNQNFQESLFRLAQVTADSGLDGPMILFSWPSEASLLGYMADRDASMASRSDLVGLIERLAALPQIRQINVAGHSMGSFLVMEAVLQLKLENRARALGKLGIILAAPDIDTDVFASQLDAIGPRRPPILVLVSKNDRALAASSVLGSDRPRVGMLDVDDQFLRDLVERFGLSVIDISTVQAPDAFGHEGFATFAAFASQIASVEASRSTPLSDVGLYVVDATTSSLATPVLLLQ